MGGDDEPGDERRAGQRDAVLIELEQARTRRRPGRLGLRLPRRLAPPAPAPGSAEPGPVTPAR